MKELIQNGENQLLIRYSSLLEKKEGYTQDKYEGDQSKIYTRYQYRYGTHLRFGITAEKDPGESFFHRNQKQGFDFHSLIFF